MRCALGGDLPPDEAVKIATNMIARVAREDEATHLVVAMDFPGIPSWRKILYPEYKANRTTDTGPWLNAAADHWVQREGWWVEALRGYEADDIMATLALRARSRPGTAVTVLSGDSDVLPLLNEGVTVVRPVNGGRFEQATIAGVCERYGVAMPLRLVDLKAMAGESGDNVPGVDGIGQKRAGQLLHVYEDLEGVIEGGRQRLCKFSQKVFDSAVAARLSKQLVTLKRDVPVGEISARDCLVDQRISGGGQ